MPPKKDEDSKYGTRLLKLFLKLTMDGKRHFQCDLVKELGCSRGTILRLVACIEEVMRSRLEIGKEGRKRYYQIKTHPHRSTFKLEFDEIKYLTMCKELASGVFPSDPLEKVKRTIGNISQLMSDPDYSRREKAQSLPVRFNPKGYIDYSPHQKSIDKILSAASNKLVCMVEYRATGESESTPRFFAPGRITFMSNALYAEGYKVPTGGTEKGRPTTLAVHRIVAVTVTDRHFDFNASDREIGTFGLKHHEVKHFRIHFEKEASEYIRERIWSTEQKLEEQDDGTVILEVGTVSEKELMAWVRSFGDQAKVVANNE